MRKTTIYCLTGCCVTFVAIGSVKTSSEKAASAPRDSKVDSIQKRNSVRPTSLVFDPKDESTYFRRGISFRAEQDAVTAEIVEVPESAEATAPVANALEEEVSRLTHLSIEGAEVLPDLLKRALSTPENSSDDLEFMTAHHKAWTVALATIQQN